jgi:peptidoglycan hydrolase CwlO-like protein
VTNGLAEILDAVGSDGYIARSLRRADRAIADTRTSVGALRNEVASQQAQISGLQSTARDLKDAVDAL